LLESLTTVIATYDTTPKLNAINLAEWSDPSANGAAQGSPGNGPGKEKPRVLCSQGVALG
jgi:hypothetical protein